MNIMMNIMQKTDDPRNHDIVADGVRPGQDTPSSLRDCRPGAMGQTRVHPPGHGRHKDREMCDKQMLRDQTLHDLARLKADGERFRKELEKGEEGRYQEIARWISEVRKGSDKI